MLPLLTFVSGGERSSSACVEQMSKEFGLTDNERQIRYPSGKSTRIGSRTAWAGTYLVQAGLLRRPRRGYLAITRPGRDLLEKNPSAIDNQLLSQYPAFVEFKERSRKPSGDDPSSARHMRVSGVDENVPEERIGAALQEIDAALKADLLERVLQSPPVFFEQLIVDLMRAMGYGGEDGGQRIGGSHDGGVDGVISEDALGLSQIYVQAKRYHPDRTISRETVQAFVGSLVGFGATKGVFVTTSSFSDPAVKYVELNTQQRVVLIDGERLTGLMVAHGVGARVAQTVSIMRVDLDYFEGEDF